LSKNKKGWENLEIQKEIIKVKGKKDVEFNVAHTRNGVLIPMSLIEGTAHEFMPWISEDLLSHDLVNGADTWYSMSSTYDAKYLEKINNRDPDF
jgi:acyl-homoserine lactone acylase PvdQ